MAQDFQPHVTGRDGTLEKGYEQLPQGLVAVPPRGVLVRPWSTPGGSVGAPRAVVDTCPGQPVTGAPIAGGPILGQPRHKPGEEENGNGGNNGPP